MSIELKVKAASLAAESAIIRRQQRNLERARQRKFQWVCSQIFKAGRPVEEINAEFNALDTKPFLNGNDPDWMKLQGHRRLDVRRASRETHLARMFIAGVPYRAVEFKTHSRPDWVAVERTVARYAPEKLTGPGVKEGQGRAYLQRSLYDWREVPPTNEMVEQAAKAREAVLARPRKERTEIKFQFQDDENVE